MRKLCDKGTVKKKAILASSGESRTTTAREREEGRGCERYHRGGLVTSRVKGEKFAKWMRQRE